MRIFSFFKSGICIVLVSSPRMDTFPLFGSNWLERIFKSVVLPAPFGPRSPKISPYLTERVMPVSASVYFGLKTPCLKVFETFSALMAYLPIHTIIQEKSPEFNLDKNQSNWYSLVGMHWF